jgi:hypothetical protein
MTSINHPASEREVPYVWTTKGNLPESMLTYSHKWEDGPSATVFSETYTLDGEVVKHAVHVLAKHGVAAESTAGGLN